MAHAPISVVHNWTCCRHPRRCSWSLFHSRAHPHHRAGKLGFKQWRCRWRQQWIWIQQRCRTQPHSCANCFNSNISSCIVDERTYSANSCYDHTTTNCCSSSNISCAHKNRLTHPCADPVRHRTRRSHSHSASHQRGSRCNLRPD